MSARVLHGDALEQLATLPDASVDAVVTDPPYGLSNTAPDQVAEAITRWTSGDRAFLPSGRGFMGHEWDGFVPPPAVWDECLRVLKPGGHLLAFAGSRTHDLMGLSIRLAGFEVRDSVAWLYGSGFPKSMDVSKAIDRASGNTNRDRQLTFTRWMKSTGITRAQIAEATGHATMGGHYLDTTSQPAIATADAFDKLRPHLPEVPEHIERLVAERTGIEWTDYVKRPQVGTGRGALSPGFGGTYGRDSGSAEYAVTAPATDAARQWEGWGTALKPAHEPITLARKPLEGTVAANVLEHGTGALNIDGCRVSMSAADRERAAVPMADWTQGGTTGATKGRTGQTFTPAPAGRWPANVVLDESQAAELDRQAPATGSWSPAGKAYAGSPATGSHMGGLNARGSMNYGDMGGASRFFYVAKAPRSERPVVDGVAHPTVKPLELMRWLVRMVTPPGGTVLDPFAGSGTTLEAGVLEGVDVIGVEREDDYHPLIQARLRRAQAEVERREREAVERPPLFEV